MSSPPRPAATVVLLRPDPGRFAVFLVRRNRRVGFMPSAWVFPGGRVDDADHRVPQVALRGGEAGIEAMGVSASRGRAALVAAVRETFEESGTWLGPISPPEAARDALNTGRTTLGEVLVAHGAVADLDRLRPWSWWITPDAEPRRYDTRFFVARIDDPEVQARHDGGETVASVWMPIDAALEGAEDGTLPMAPPTWWTLRELAALPDLDAVFAARRPGAPICPILDIEGRDLTLILPGHPEHPDPAIPDLPSAVGFAQGRWWAGAVHR